ncbi:energy transducer TonB [uncultured Algibacter sp.]|uniref:energy transducer TonB n=1 Tax=uncultured Algibacter sp. TaxID=298659 RepID=UPI002622630B|nr:energy transducer TonB [uncultured Algibacter sp.]
MNTSKKSRELIRQNEQIAKKPQKHDANLQKNSTLYFQIGLIVCLLFTYGLFEMNFESTIPKYADLPPLDEPEYVDVPIIKPIEPTFEEPIEQKKSKQPKDYDVVPDDVELNPVLPTIDDPVIDDNPPINPDDIVVIEIPDEAPVPFISIQDAPIYPGCEKFKNNDDRKQCMSDKISKLILRKFDTSIASDYGLTGRQRISVIFEIDKTGNVTNIESRAPHPKLDEEAKRVISKIPQMTPGRQHDKNVGVIYTQPIIFQIEN